MLKRMPALVSLAAVAVLAALTVVSPAGAARQASSKGAAFAKGTGEFVVMYADGVSTSAARAAIRASGGTVRGELRQIGLAQVQTNDAAFSERLMATGTAKAVVRNHSIGTAAPGMGHKYADERAVEDRAAYTASAEGDPGGVPNGPKDKKEGPEPFSYLQWGP